MSVEYDAQIRNQTWELVPLPKGMNIAHCKWVYKTNFDADGQIEKHKAQLVAKGFSQKQGIDYIETFVSVAMMDSIQMILFFAASLNWEVLQMDVKSACLSLWRTQEEIYMQQPPGFVQDGPTPLVCNSRSLPKGLSMQLELGMGKSTHSFLVVVSLATRLSNISIFTVMAIKTSLLCFMLMILS